MNAKLRKQGERAAEIIFETRSRLLHPAQRFGIAAGLVQRIDQVEIRSLRTWCFRKAVDEEFVCFDGVVRALHAVVG